MKSNVLGVGCQFVNDSPQLQGITVLKTVLNGECNKKFDGYDDNFVV